MTTPRDDIGSPLASAFPVHYAEMEELFARTIGRGARSIAVTSANSGEGRTGIAYALARRSAVSGRRTLMIDVDTSGAGLGRQLGLPPMAWSPDQGSDTLAIPLGGTGLSLLPTPGARSFAPGFRERQTLRDYLDAMLERYDAIVVDTSPLGQRNQGNIPPDLVAATCEGVVLVVLAGRTSEPQVIDAVRKLNDAEANLLGAVLNDRELPSLTSEMIRETHRFDRWADGAMARLRAWIRRNTFLGQEI